MQFFNTKKPAADTAALDAAEEHKQSIGDQVMEALGVGDGAEEQMHPEENTEIMMPKKNQSQLAAEEMMKQHESICVISPDAVIKGGIEVKDAVMVAGRVMGDIVATTVTCVGEHCYIEGNVKCAELQMHGGKIRGNIEADTKAVVNGAIEGNITCKEDVFGEHAAVIGEYNQMIEMWLSEMTNTHTCVDAREYTEAYIDDDSEKTLIFPIIELEELVYQKAGREKYHIVCERGTQDGISRTMGNKVIDFKDMNNELMPAHKYDDAGIRRDGINPLTHSGYWEEEP